ncbi:hypothetical protein AAG906_017934 [Vitis piasezkii]
MGQDYEDHLVTSEDVIPNVDKAKGLYTNDIQRFYKVVYDIVHVRQQDMDLSTYIGRIASLKEEFLTLMPFTNGAEAQQIQIDKFFMVLIFIGLRPDLESVRDKILSSPSVPSLDDVFAASLTPLLYSDLVDRWSLIHHRCYRLHGRPPHTAHIARSSILLSPFGSDYDAYLRYQAATSASVACVAQIDGKTIGIGRESQGLYHLISPSFPATCISTDAPLLIHSRLGQPSLSKFQKMVPHFSTLSSLACESCQLGKHTRVLFPKCLNNWTKSPFELVYTDVWGLCRTASTLGFQYFVTFIDDYSRLTMFGNIFPHPLLLLCPNMGFSISHLVTTSPPRLRNASSWDTLDFRRAIVVISLTLIVIFSSLMSPSLRTLYYSHPLNLFPFLKYCHFPIYPLLQMRSLVLFRPSLIPPNPNLSAISLSLSLSFRSSVHILKAKEKTLSVGRIIVENTHHRNFSANFSANFPATFFLHRKERWRRSPICPKAPEPEPIHAPPTRFPAGDRISRARDSLDADHPPFLPVCAIRALHVPLLGFFCFRGPSDQIFRRPPAIFLNSNPRARKCSSTFRSMTKYGMASSRVSSVTSPESGGRSEIPNLGGSDSSPILITGHKLNGHNYLQWSQSCSLFICGKGKEKRPCETTEPGFVKWKIEKA